MCVLLILSAPSTRNFLEKHTNALLSAVSLAKNTLYGSLAADTNLRFALVSSNDLPHTLNGTVSFNVTNGQLGNGERLDELEGG